MMNSPVVRTDGLQRLSEGMVGGVANRLGIQVVLDFYSYMAMMGAAFQVRAGTITTPLVGDVVITDAAAEMAVNALAGTTIIPLEVGIGVRLATGTLHEYAVKSVAGASSGTAFVPLPLRTGSQVGTGGVVAASSPAFVAAAGGVTVPAELATTTRRHFEYANPVAAGAGNDVDPLLWTPRVPPILVGAYTLYCQIAATTTGPSYFAHMDFIEADTTDLL
jgi:hypothetical protein